MASDQNAALEAKIRRLEIRVARLRALLLTIAFVATCASTLGFCGGTRDKPPSTITATRFVLVDDQGKELAVLGRSPPPEGRSAKGNRVGLSVFPRSVDKEIPELIFVGSEQVDNRPDIEYGKIELGSQVSRAKSMSIMAYLLSLSDTDLHEEIEISTIGYPALKFLDRSGTSFVELSHVQKDGVRFSIRAPLGIVGAHDEVVKAHIEGKDIDPKLEEAWRKSLRIDFAAPPFSEPYLRLVKDGKIVWSAK